MLGCLPVSSFHHLRAFLNGRSRLHFPAVPARQVGVDAPWQGGSARSCVLQLLFSGL